jgi:hypothetical protein
MSEENIEVKKILKPKDRGAIKKKKSVNARGLTNEQESFVHEYVRCGGKASTAYRSVYPNVKNSTSEVNSCKLLRNTKIKEAISEEYCKIWKEKDTESFKGSLVAQLNAIRNATIDSMVNIEDGVLTVKDIADIPPEALLAISGIDYSESNTEAGQSKRVSLKLRDSLKAIEMIAKIIKIIDPKADTQQVEIIIKPPVRPDKVPGDESNEPV